MDDLCRICLESLEGTYKVSLTDTFKGLRVFEYINSLTNIEIKVDDGLPSTICYTCYREFETVMAFREKCEQSDIKLKQRYELQIKNEIEYELKQEYNSYLETANIDSDGDQTISFLKSATPVEYDGDHLNSNPHLSSEKEDLSCSKCNAIFKTPKTLYTHLAKNKCEALKFECDDCGEVFKSKCKIVVHWRRKHLLSKLICPRCKTSCKTYAAFNNHKLKKTCSQIDDQLMHIEGVGNNRVFKCKECSYSTKTVLRIIVHVRTHTGERPYKCSYCPNRFRQISTLQFHQDYVHKRSLLPKEKCHICGKFLPGKRRLATHIARCHNHPVVKCTVCNKSLLRASLEIHMARHTDAKNYTCEVCAKSFYSLSELCNHKRKVHNKHIKRFQCELCPYKTYRTDLLRKHVDRHRDGSHACTICFMFFKDQNMLGKHQQIHKEENKFQCQYCELKYLTRKCLLTHVTAKHTGPLVATKYDTLKSAPEVKEELFAK